jgi:hypothetical protein
MRKFSSTNNHVSRKYVGKHGLGCMSLVKLDRLEGYAVIIDILKNSHRLKLHKETGLTIN